MCINKTNSNRKQTKLKTMCTQTTAGRVIRFRLLVLVKRKKKIECVCVSDAHVPVDFYTFRRLGLYLN